MFFRILYLLFIIGISAFNFQLEVKGTGWVSLALTYRGNIMGSDIIIGWVAADQSATIIVRFNFVSNLFMY